MGGYRFFWFAVVFLCLRGNNALSSEEKAELKEALHPFLMQCVEEFGVTEEQFEEAKKKGSDAEIDPCFMSCFLKKAEFFDSKGMFDVEKSASFAESYLKGEQSIKFYEKVSSDCAKVNDEEVSDGEKGCDRAKLLFECIAEVKKAYNFDD